MVKSMVKKIVFTEKSANPLLNTYHSLFLINNNLKFPFIGQTKFLRAFWIVTHIMGSNIWEDSVLKQHAMPETSYFISAERLTVRKQTVL